MSEEHLVEPEAFKRMAEDEIRLYVELDGWKPSKLVHAAGDRYYPHSHPEEKLLVILTGSMQLRLGREWTTLLTGDKAVVPGNMNHEAIIGKKGCALFWAERLPKKEE